ncbi:MAG: arginase family protein [Candidatus Dormibacterales bacterium]
MRMGAGAAAPAGMDLAGLLPWGGLAAAPPGEAGAVVAGIPYDGSAAYRRGAAQAPGRLRDLSRVMPPVDERGRSLGVSVHDLGDLDLGPAVEEGWEAVASRLSEVPPSALLTVLGGDHCATVPVLAAQARRHPGLAVLWLDAHPDLCEVSRGGRWTCGCALRRGLEVAGIPSAALVMAGARDFDPEEVDWITEQGVLMIPSADLAADPRGSAARIARAVGDRPLHVSFDIDVLDPAFAPGTEIPSAGGISTRQALDALRALSEAVPLVGLDVAEVAPPLDVGDITSLAALKLVFEFWGMAWRPPTRSS